MSGCCGSSCPEMDNPPTRGHMGVLQIIELVIMGIVGILAIYDIINILGYPFNFWTVLTLFADGAIIAGLIFIVIGLFCSTSTGKIRVGIYCFFGGTILNIILIVYYLIYASQTVEVWLIGILKVAILIFLAYVLWRQSKNV